MHSSWHQPTQREFKSSPGGAPAAPRRDVVARALFQVPAGGDGRTDATLWASTRANHCAPSDTTATVDATGDKKTAVRSATEAAVVGVTAVDSVAFVDDPPEAVARKEAAGKRNMDKASRIGYLRDSFRAALAGLKPSALVLFDGDLRTLPPAAEVAAAVELVLSGEWDLVCSNGRMGHRGSDRYYDTYATVLHNGSYPFKRIYLDVKQNGRNPQREIKMAREWFADVENGARMSNERVVVPVQSCFGGLAVYSARYSCIPALLMAPLSS
jgi:hypothetical protein